jgi:hypothetical protein
VIKLCSPNKHLSVRLYVSEYSSSDRLFLQTPRGKLSRLLAPLCVIHQMMGRY